MVSPEITEASSAVSSWSGSAATSWCLMSSQLFSEALVFTNVHEPLSLRPRNVIESLPASMPARTRASASSRSPNAKRPSSSGE